MENSRSGAIPFAVISHNDLDGAVSAAVLMHVLERRKERGACVAPFTRFVVGAGRVADEAVLDLAELGIPSVVADLSIGDEAWNALVSVERPAGTEDVPFLFDHHPESVRLGRAAKFGGAVVDTGVSAALLCLSHFAKKDEECFRVNERLVVAARLADDYDMWRHEYPESKRLNAFLSVVGADAVVRDVRCMDGLVGGFDAAYDRIVDSWFERQRGRVEKAARSSMTYESSAVPGMKLVVVSPREMFSTGDLNETAEKFKREGAACAAFILDTDGGARISLRSGRGIARAVLKELEAVGASGGGHPNACGARFSFSDPQLPAVVAAAFERAVSRMFGSDAATGTEARE